ncbi:MAG TPA: menaquinone biosynthesis protein [Thermoanaerobaculia bacterium]|nr:menaquinone biosynthesis protein [Thermoanaerobaculia bacterium]
MNAPLRIGIVHYLNSWPLARGLRQGLGGDGVEALDLPPAVVADRLAAGTLEVGLVPTIELARIPGVRRVGELGIAAVAEVRSVLLVSRRPLAEIRSVAVDVNSRTSVALLRLLLAARGLDPAFTPAPPAVDEMLAAHDAALLIGDPALAVDRDRVHVLDLAAAWRELTGLPFVFAVWAATAEGLRPGLAELLAESFAIGRRELPQIVSEAAHATGLPAPVLRDYFTRHLRYPLGPDELAGLAEFHRRAHAHGLIASLPAC